MEAAHPPTTMTLDVPEALTIGSVVALEDYATGCKGQVRVATFLRHESNVPVDGPPRGVYKYVIEPIPGAAIVLVS